jgi:hypothetical protein
MIDDLKRDSARWRQEQDRRTRRGQGTGMIYLVESYLQMAEEITGSYADMKGRQEVESYVDTMDVDDDYGPPSRRHDVDVRTQPAGRHGVAPVSSAYPPEPAYYVSSNLPGNYGPETLPRTHAAAYRTTGGSTPPTSRAGQTGYDQPNYPSRTSAVAPPVPVSSYRDPRTGQVISGYEPTYPPDTGRRHR